MKRRAAARWALFLWATFLAGAALGAGEHDALTGPFPNGPAVTRACLACHPEAAAEIMKTSHWTWLADQVQADGSVKARGKRNAINNFCTSILSNEPRCTSCHIGYGFADQSFDFSDSSKVDCLICHDTTGTYKKIPDGAGRPLLTVNLSLVARNVGKTNRRNCGACHFFGGGGDNVKHGDLGTPLLDPPPRVDVHMSLDRGDLACTDCHFAKGHTIRGHTLLATPRGSSHMHCTECHDERPHAETLIDDHALRVACQSCHIPTFAKEMATKMWWDWSKAGEARSINEEKYGRPLYDRGKGEFDWEMEVEPVYFWFDGNAEVYELGDPVDPAGVTPILKPTGSRADPKSRIAPFKRQRGMQAYDKKRLVFAVPHLYGSDGFWTTYDWPSALRIGMKAAGMEFSGEYGFAETVLYRRITHMVAPAEKSLGCLDCHGMNGRLDWKALGYEGDPIRSGK